MSKKVHQINDKFFKIVMADKAAAVAFFETYLSSEIKEIVDFDSLKPADTSYLNKDLEASFSDIVFELNTSLGLKTQVSILLEHKSYVDKYTAFQVLEYLALAYKKQLANKLNLMPIIPLVFYHGQAKWEYKELQHFFKEHTEVFKPYIPQHHTQFIDLKKYEDSQLLQIRNVFLASALLLQKNYTKPNELINSLLNIHSSFEEYLENAQLQSIFVYVFQNEKLDNNVITEKIKALPASQKDNIMSIYDQLIEQGHSKGLIEGIEKGRFEGIEEGIEKGIEKEAEKVIINAFKNQLSLETIRLITGETSEKINAILKKNGLI